MPPLRSVLLRQLLHVVRTQTLLVTVVLLIVGGVVSRLSHSAGVVCSLVGVALFVAMRTPLRLSQLRGFQKLTRQKQVAVGIYIGMALCLLQGVVRGEPPYFFLLLLLGIGWITHEEPHSGR